MAVSVKPFGRFWNQDIKATVLSNKNGMEVEVLDYGCIMRRLVVPGKTGSADVILGFAVKACFKGSLRVSEEAEAQGLDVAAHGESAYPAYIGLD